MTQESTNYARLCRLLVDVGFTVLRDTFDSVHLPTNLHVVLSSPSVLSKLQSLRKKRVLEPLQWGKLFPAVASSVSSANFNGTLLMVLLRNICGLSPPVSTGSWDQPPADSDNSTAANMVRIKCYRNDVYGHATKASVDDATFNALWQKISSAVLALGTGYGDVISRLKTECMDSATEAHYQKLLSDWKKDDDSLKEMGAVAASTQENTNFARLCRLLVDVGFRVLRDTFDRIHPPGNLRVVLSSRSVLPTLKSLRQRRVLDSSQWEKLFPAVASSVSSDNFDGTLLMVLLRNICRLRPPVSTGSWDKLPPDSDNSTEANMVRLKCYRNDVFHAFEASVNDEKFNDLWQKISSAVLALGSGYASVINRLKTECMDPAVEAHYQQLLLSDWKKDEQMQERIYAKLGDIEGMIKQQVQERSTAESQKDKCEAAVKALIAGFATQVNRDGSLLPVALASINECKREENSFDKEMAQSLGSHLKLQTVDCSGLTKELVAVCIETLKTNSTVTKLVLNHCDIDDANAAELAGQLKENSTLTWLNLSDNDIGGVGADALAKGLKENSTLKLLNLSSNHIGNVGADALAKGLKKNSTLTLLDLSANDIDQLGAGALAKGLNENSTLTSLNLSSNHIGDVGADALTKILKENSTLTSLILSNNAIDNDGADALAKGLKENSTLTLLDLFHNNIGGVGTDALAKGLKENSTLTYLDLSQNQVGPVGADALAKGLKENSTLTSLILCNNAIGNDGADALAKGLKENATLTWLNLATNNIGKVGANALAQGLVENSTLKSDLGW